MTVRQLKWTKDLKPACLPQPLTQDFAGAVAVVTGWGFTDEDRGKGMFFTIKTKFQKPRYLIY